MKRFALKGANFLRCMDTVSVEAHCVIFIVAFLFSGGQLMKEGISSTNKFFYLIW